MTRRAVPSTLADPAAGRGDVCRWRTPIAGQAEGGTVPPYRVFKNLSNRLSASARSFMDAA